MKVTARTKRHKRITIREAMTSLIVFSIVLLVPVFSIYEFGHFFHGTDSRTNIVLPAMTQRAVDKTTLPPQLFQEPLISVTFDDGFESMYKNALPLLQKYGIHSTQFIIAGEFDNPEYVSLKQTAEIQQAGHEIACHTMTHPDLTTLSPAMVNYQLSDCKAILSSHFGTIDDFASPYGAANASTTAAVSQYFDSQRNTNGDPTNGVTDADVNIASNFNRYNIIGVTIQHNTTVAELQALVAYAKKNNGWVVITYHQADEGGGSQFEVDTPSLEKQLAYLSSTNVRIVTMHDALAATRLQNVEY
jgi:peptidoglycan/xylan/chitin deacetylase (PgdA/CDA1 family)